MKIEEKKLFEVSCGLSQIKSSEALKIIILWEKRTKAIQLSLIHRSEQEFPTYRMMVCDLVCEDEENKTLK